MAVYIAQAYVAFDGGASNNAWALSLAQWVKDNTQALGNMALVAPGTAGERSSYCVVSEVQLDGSLTPLSAWHVNDLGVVTEGLPDGTAVPPVIPEWAAGVAYATDDVVSYQGVSYRCLQGHTSQSNWKPSTTASLWVAI